jgi:hypothetical protein
MKPREPIHKVGDTVVLHTNDKQYVGCISKIDKSKIHPYGIQWSDEENEKYYDEVSVSVFKETAKEVLENP